jgi:glycosyltransferase involved in cell wall biosynthesis
MRVGISCYWFNRGQGVVGRQLRSALEELGHETFVLARPTRAKNLKPSYIAEDDVWDQPGVTRASAYRIPAEELERWAREHELEVAMFDQNYQFEEIERLRRMGVRTIGRFVWEHFGREHVEPARRAFDTVYSVTACERERYAALGLETPHVPWGIHPELLRAAPEGKERRDDGEVRFFFPGGFMSRRKPLGPTLKAFRKARGEELRLLVKAQVERGVDEVAKAARRDPRIEVIAADLPTDEHLALFASADVCLAPSRWEGLGLHLFEATALGLPILTNDNPPMNEIVQHERNGLLVRGVRSRVRPRSDIGSFDPHRRELTRAIERLRDPDLRARLAAGARERREELRWERTVAALRELLEPSGG